MIRALRKPAVVAVALVCGLLLAVASQTKASVDRPFVPASDSLVLENLPSGVANASTRQLRRLREALDKDPTNLAFATRVARLNIEQSRMTGDPRYLGHAQAALSSWWKLNAPPAEVLFLRAVIRQSLHDFKGALADLKVVLRSEPQNAEALLTYSTILIVRGEYREAEQSCERLTPLVSELVSGACLATVESLTGRARNALSRLTTLYERANAEPPGERAWASSILGETASRIGDAAEGESYLKKALQLSPDDSYTLGTYADLLLDSGRPTEVVTLLRGQTQNDSLLLRLAIAELRMGRAEGTEHARLLRERFAANRRRGDSVHRREEARFELMIERNAQKALQLSQDNWDVQREPWDARLLLESALATRQLSVASPAIEWLDSSRLEDPILRNLVAQVRARQ